MQACCLIGRGSAYIAKANNGLSWGYQWGYSWGVSPEAVNAGRFLGNVTSLSVTPNYSQRRIANVVNMSSGTRCSAGVLESVEVSLTLTCNSLENLKDAFFGTIFKQLTPLPPVVNEVVVAPDGMFLEESFVAFSNIGVDPTSVVIVDADTLVPLVAGVDYIASKTGIKFLSGYSNDIQISYSYTSGFECVEAFTQTPDPVQILIDGFNLADTSQLYQIRIYKARLSPTDNYSFIGDDFAEITLTGTIDPYYPSAGAEPKWLSIKRVS